MKGPGWGEFRGHLSLPTACLYGRVILSLSCELLPSPQKPQDPHPFLRSGKHLSLKGLTRPLKSKPLERNYV